MFIKKILSQHRRDFTALYECEHCGKTEKSGGYDDDYYHREVIPNKQCPKCKKTAKQDYIPMVTKYPEGYQI